MNISSSSESESERPSIESSISKDEYARRLERIVKGFHPTSGIEVLNEGPLIWIDPKPTPTDFSDDQLIEWYEKREGITIKELLGYGGTKEEILREIRREKSREYIGGLGITERNLFQTYENVPELENMLIHEEGKVVVLGAGFGSLPLELADLYRRKQLSEPPVIVDLFDYPKAYEELLTLKQLFENERIRFPFSEALENMHGIAQAIRNNEITPVRYRIGSGQLPSIVKDASLVVNVHGPTQSSLYEQLGTLKIGGKWIYAGDLRNIKIPPEYQLQKFATRDGRGTYCIITRLI